ncbi:UDP-N-acetylmuramate dehydrogenase [Halosquirtibacter xylanolyticus]|uniref:UDP-N-acetylmuramate dehydrogenase n=1 Tax=Halosquirtibacter xylanolyticus TaxID=3374599 RepID=UPI0037484979|nr:UDP-N-acetylmuramate dehydrogenase [Prolixibacteraceae bacterium]
MLFIQKDYPLKSLNTFGVDAKAKYFISFDSIDDIEELNCLLTSRFENEKKFVLGGGSNVLFTEDFDGLVMQSHINNIIKETNTDSIVTVEVGSGMVWDHFVAYCVSKGWGGVENLSHIPGVVGAAPVQNIGAYGIEAKDVIEEVCFWDFETESIVVIKNDDCHFGYRDSIFKHRYKGLALVLSVTFKLTLKDHAINIGYGALKDLESYGADLSLTQVRERIVEIRESKLPNPEVIGNGGSFFKNPVLDKEVVDNLLKHYPQMVVYPLDSGKVKVAAGWLIEHAGWKGYTEGAVGVHDKQSLVLVNHGAAKGNDVVALAQKIIKDIDQKFGIKLEPEVIFL